MGSVYGKEENFKCLIICRNCATLSYLSTSEDITYIYKDRRKCTPSLTLWCIICLYVTSFVRWYTPCLFIFRIRSLEFVLLSDYVILILWLLLSFNSIINDHFSSFWGQIEHHPKCCTITACATSHNKSTSRTIAHNRRSLKQRRTELSNTICEIEIRNQK